MRLDVHIPERIYAATLSEAKQSGLSQSQVIRNILAKAYGVSASLPERKNYEREAS